jgi:SAM-dependent methyltransferase
MSIQATGNDPQSLFAKRMIEIINDGGLSLLLSIGHRTALFEVMARLQPSTSDEIADASGLDVECVREWLDAMASADIVGHDATSGRYDLPSDHAAVLSQQALSGNLAALADHVPVLGAAEDRIVERFQKGRRTPFPAYAGFRRLVSDGSDEQVTSALVDWILPLVPGLSNALEAGIDVLDLGCGPGRALSLMAARFPLSRFHGYDPSAGRIDRARWRSFQLGLTNIRFRVKSLDQIDETDRFDLIADFDAIRDRVRPREALARIERALRPGGTLLMQEVTAETVQAEDVAPEVGAALQSVSHMRRLMAQLERKWGDDASLGQGGPVRRVLEEVGFEEVSVRRLHHEVHNRYFIARKRGGAAAAPN